MVVVVLQQQNHKIMSNTKQSVTFDQLPGLVADLHERQAKMEALLTEIAKKTATGEPDRVMFLAEAAEFLKLKESTLYSKVSKGEVPVHKRGTRLTFSRNELIQWSLSGTRESNLTEDQRSTIAKMRSHRNSYK